MKKKIDKSCACEPLQLINEYKNLLQNEEDSKFWKKK